MKNVYRKVGVLIFAVCMMFTLTSCGNRKNDTKAKELSLEMFRTDQEYQFQTIKWGSTMNETADQSANKLEIDKDRQPFPEGYVIYRSQQNYVLAGKNCSASFEFLNDGLNMVQLDFQLTDQDPNWINAQIFGLVQLYGSENEKTERENEELHMKTEVYKWETDQTMLQFTVVTGNSGEPHVVLTLVRK